MPQFSMINAFPINFGVFNVGEESRAINKQILKEVYRIKDEEEPRKRTGKNVFQTSLGLENRSELFAHLKNYFTDLLTPYVQDSGFTGEIWEYLEVGSFWFNYNNKAEAYHVPHNHGFGDTVFSAVYYPTSGILKGKHLSDDQDLDAELKIDFTNRPPAGSLVMFDPNFALKRAVQCPNRQTNYPYYGNSMCITPREGALVIFPTYLVHMVVPTEQHDFERMSIVFNINKKHG